MCNTGTTKILTYKYHPGEIIKQDLSNEITELRLLTERQRQRIQVRFTLQLISHWVISNVVFV